MTAILRVVDDVIRASSSRSARQEGLPMRSTNLDYRGSPSANRTLGSSTIRIAVIDDNRLVRDALTSMLCALDDLHAVASATADAAFIAEANPDVILLDVGLGDEDSLGVAAALAQNAPAAKVILMDLVPVNDEIVDYVNAGVCGFVLKDATFDEFVATIRAVAAGDKVLPPRLTESLFSQIAKAAGPRAHAHALEDVRMTRREHEVIGLIGEGLSNKEIAMRLNIATHTVKSHVRNVMEKLALHTRLQIAAYSHREASP